jgi:hypothetical protein
MDGVWNNIMLPIIDAVNAQNIFDGSGNDYSGRSFTQRLITKSPSLYILLKRDNNGLKKTLINIKGYRAIKNNKDVMKSAKDLL